MSNTVLALAAVLAAVSGPQDDTMIRLPAPEGLGLEPSSEVRVIVGGQPGREGPGRLDGDGDGVVTREEFIAPLGRTFDRLDSDRDGRLTKSEMDAQNVLTPAGPGGDIFMFRQVGPDAGRPGAERMTVHRFDGPAGAGSLDRDGDGKVSEAEFLAPLRESFRTLDADGDGSLSGRERSAPSDLPRAPGR